MDNWRRQEYGVGLTPSQEKIIILTIDRISWKTVKIGVKIEMIFIIDTWNVVDRGQSIQESGWASPECFSNLGGLSPP